MTLISITWIMIGTFMIDRGRGRIESRQHEVLSVVRSRIGREFRIVLKVLNGIAKRCFQGSSILKAQGDRVRYVVQSN